MTAQDPSIVEAGRMIVAAEAVARDIKAMGVEIVFGLISDDTAVICASLDATGVRFVGARHENQAISMAEGYAAATGRMGVAIIGRGPAFANGFNGLTMASRTRQPVLVVIGEAPAGAGLPNAMGPDYKHLDQAGILDASGIAHFAPRSADEIRAALRQASDHACRNDLAVLLLPTDLQETAVAAEPDAPVLTEGRATPVALAQDAPAPPHAVEMAASFLQARRKPVILAGRGADRAGAREAIVALAEKLGAALATSALGKDLFRGHPANIGIVGSFSHAMCREVLQECDCVLVVGASLNALTMTYGHSLPAVPVIQIDRDRRAIGRWTAVDMALAGDARATVEALTAALPERGAEDKPLHAPDRLERLAAFDVSTDFEAKDTERTLDPRSTAVILNDLLPEARNVVYDGGNYMCAIPFIDVRKPADLKLTTESYSIGLGFGNAIGFAAGRPGETTVLMIGDGGFVMTMGEMETVLREDIPIVIVLFNDCAYSSELQVLLSHGQSTALSQFPDIDFSDLAEALGYEAHVVRTRAELEALRDVLAAPEGPVFVECKTNPEVFWFSEG